MKIAVVILNWNGLLLLKEFLPSVIKYSNEAIVYVADNDSTDDSVTYIKTTFPEVIIIKNETNGGYAKGYNDALSHIDADIFCLLNNDVEVTENWLVPIMDLFQDSEEIAAIQPKILDSKRKNYFEYAGAAGGFMDQLAYPYCRGRIFDTLEKDVGQYDDETTIFWASGACLFIRRTIFEEVGKLDEDFFAHMEEIDLCWRIQNYGYLIKYTAGSTVYHLGGATLDSMNPKKTFLNFRNSLFMMLKNISGYNVWILLFLRMILDAVAGAKFLLEGNFKHFTAILKAHIDFYKQFHKIYKKRKTNVPKKKYYLVFSVVWRYYVLRKKVFKQL